jgi:hypothetical protein
MRRPRSTAIDSGTIAATGDGSTAPSENLDGSGMVQVGEPERKLSAIPARNEGIHR